MLLPIHMRSFTRASLAMLVGIGAFVGVAVTAPDASGEAPRSPAVSQSSPSSRAVLKKPAPPVKKKKGRRKPIVKKVVPGRVTSRLGFATNGLGSGMAGSGGVEPLVNEAALPPMVDGSCPSDMALIESRFCVDRYEGSLLEIASDGERPFSPYEPVDGHVVRAVSVAGVFPQGYISGLQAQDACARSGKRLCRAAEWRKACAGPQMQTFGYSDTRQRGRCNDAGRSPMLEIFHLGGDSDRSMWDPIRMNDTRLNQLPGSLARTGDHPSCTNGYGVFDMVGNLHEWVDDPSGTFQGGYYLDTTINGEGCGYRTTAHEFAYHDYSTGFRCCADPE
jgi:hypothetical protein